LELSELVEGFVSSDFKFEFPFFLWFCEFEFTADDIFDEADFGACQIYVSLQFGEQVLFAFFIALAAHSVVLFKCVDGLVIGVKSAVLGKQGYSSLLKAAIKFKDLIDLGRFGRHFVFLELNDDFDLIFPVQLQNAFNDRFFLLASAILFEMRLVFFDRFVWWNF
jgi:hypothetical protein